MTQYNYIVLESDDQPTPTYTGQFTVLQEGYTEVLSPIEAIADTIEGGVDISLGSVREIRPMVLKVPYTASNPSGTIATLNSLFRLRSPNAMPSNVIIFTDNAGQKYRAIFTGSLERVLIGHSVEGDYAWSAIKITLRLLGVYP